MQPEQENTQESKPQTEVPTASEPNNEQLPQPLAEEPKPPADQSRWQRFLVWYKADKKKSIPLTVLVLIILLAGIPWSRYHAAGLVLKKGFSLQILDSTAHTPVSGAQVSVGSINGITDGSGKVRLHGVPVGSHSASISKKYYKDRKASVLVPILSQKNTPKINFIATGRQVKIVVSNVINHQSLSGVDIEVADIKAKTDKSGEALIVLPVGTKSHKAKLSAKDYNDAEVTIAVSQSSLKENKFNLTPAGKVYFLSKLSGKIDVVKTNLDGSNRQTVLAGTGKEDNRNTVLLASRDWKYLALLSRRDDSPAKLYLIEASSDGSLATIDQGASSSFNLVGWSDDSFVYTVTRADIPQWQAHGQALKSFNADTKQTLTLDQTRAEGTSQTDYVQEAYGQVYQINKNIIYEKSWSAYYTNLAALNSKQAGIYSISATGSSPQTLKTFGYETGKTTYINSIPYEANQIYYQATDKSTVSYYSYGSGKLTPRSDLADEFNSAYNAVTYLQSPSGNETFWAEPRDGKNTLFIGDQNGAKGKQIASLSDYFTYGWFKDEYLLVSKNSSELYIMPHSGPSVSSPPIKISDYHKPAINYQGYGGGYGGI